jgi:type I restriction enzyme R subunit
LYYENRIPELQLTNENLNGHGTPPRRAELDERGAKARSESFLEYHLIVRDDRLEKIAEDIVLHFMGRGFPGKAMFVAVDKATAVRMFNKVKHYWGYHLAILEAELESRSELDHPELEAKIKFMKETDMAVVVSQGQNEIAELREKGLNIQPHRRRMVEEDLDTKFKDPNDPFRIVFVCAMWMTGFDVPSCSTIYLDKPMRNHTLMQTIARANRVWGEKVNGLIVDYIGVFRDLQRALAIYGSASGGGIGPGEVPVETKQALIKALEDAIQETRVFLSQQGVILDEIHEAAADIQSFRGVKKLDDCVNCLLVNDDTKRTFLNMADYVDRLFKAILPDFAANRFSLDRKVIVVIAEEIRSLILPADISDVMEDVEELLDRSIAPTKEGYRIVDSPYEISVQ